MGVDHAHAAVAIDIVAAEQQIARLEGYLHMADFGTCAADWPLMDEFDQELSQGRMPK
jgi:hypothetical protein